MLSAPPSVRPPRSAAWWIIPAVFLVLATVYAVDQWLLKDIPIRTGADAATFRIEIIRTALAAGVAVGGAVTLMLAFRRQRHQELANLLSAHDATERRVTELYTKSAEQLGNERAAVRLAGLYALERLAQDNPGHRQTIINVICAYLRMPYALPVRAHSRGRLSLPSGFWRTRLAKPELSTQEELQVRSTAQRILADHLIDSLDGEDRQNGPIQSHYWSGMDVNLSGATLVEADFWYAHFFSADFTGATFVGEASFFHATFDDTVKFDKATFMGFTSFVGATFNRHAWFNGASFLNGVALGGASFRQQAVLDDASFSGYLGLKETKFDSDIFFERPTLASASPEFDQMIIRDLTANFYLSEGWQVKKRADGSGYLAPARGLHTVDATPRQRQTVKQDILRWLHDRI